MTAETDIELLKRYTDERDDLAFTLLMERHRQKVYAFIYRRVGSRDDAMDLCQKTFINVFMSAGGFEGRSGFRTWLYRIALNVITDFLRQNRKRPFELVDNEAGYVVVDSVASNSDKQRSAVVRRAMEELPEKQREALMLRVCEELSYEEISDVTGAPIGTVKANLHHAIAALRKKLGGGDGL